MPDTVEMQQLNKRARELEILARCTPLIYEQKTVRDVLTTAGRIVGREMGYHCAVLTIEGKNAAIRHLSAPQAALDAIRAALGQEIERIKIPLSHLKFFTRAQNAGTPVFIPSLNELESKDNNDSWARLSSLLTTTMGNNPVRMLAAPVITDEACAAIIYVFGPDLTESDSPTIQHFTQIVASALQRLQGIMVLEDSRRLLLLRNEIAQAFLTGKGEDVYQRVLGIMMNATQSWGGMFGYLNETGALVHPSICTCTPNGDSATNESLVLQRHEWTPVWENIFTSGKPQRINKPHAHNHTITPISRALLIPIIFDDQPIGTITVGSKDSDYTIEDVFIAETLTGYIAPLLFARLRAESLEEKRRNSESALRESEKRFRLTADLSPFPVSIIGDHGRYEYINPRFTDIFGYNLNDIPTGRDWFQRAFPDPEYREEAMSAWKEGLTNADGHRVQPAIFKVTCKDGAQRIIIFRPHILKEGKHFVVYEDITERERSTAEKEILQQQLLQAQKMEAVGTLAGGIAHDFNNMLAIIIGNAQLAKAGLQGHENAEEVDEILKAANRTRDLTMKLLTFSRKEKVSVRAADINTIIQDIVSMLEHTMGRDININLDLEQNLAPVRMDKNQIHQSLLNLCTNARDAMPEGGDLHIQTRATEMDEDYRRRHPQAGEGPHCRIRISDTGMGMDADTRRKMFEPFFTTKSEGKGTGLGLYITWGIVKNHGGHMHVDSKLGQGAAIDILLPLAQGAEPENTSANEPEQNHTGTGTVLVIDDERSLLRMAGKMLSRAGYNPILARGGPEAVEIFRKRHGEIRAVILDMIMPDMDGTDVFRALKAMDPDVCVVLASGFSVEGRVAELVAEGVRGFVQKPFSTSDLTGALQDVIRTPA